MMFLLLCLLFGYGLCADCDMGFIEDCYSVNVWKHHLPPDDVTTCGDVDDVMMYKTENITESVEVRMTVAVAVVAMTSLNGNLTTLDACEAGPAEYNMSLLMDLNKIPADIESAQWSIPEVYMLPQFSFEDITSGNLGLGDIKNLIHEVTDLNWVKSFVIPSGDQTLYFKLIYNSPEGNRDCVLEIFMYSCWIKHFLIKILAAALGGTAALCCIVACPIVACICCCCICKKKK